MKYRIEPKPEGRRRFKPYLETESLDEVRQWLAHPPIPVNARIRGTDGTYYQLTTAGFHDLAVYMLAAVADGSNERVLAEWVECRQASTVASRETEEGCRQIERWTGASAGSMTVRAPFDR